MDMVYIFLADGFEELEALNPVDVLRRAQIPVTTVGVGGKTVTGSHNIPVICDRTVDEITSFEDMEMVVLPGGMPGTVNLENHPVVQKVLDQAAEKEIWIGAICAAPSVLGHKGLLNGKKAVCFPGFEDALQGAELSQQSVCIDGHIITAKGAGVALPFALTLVKCLKGDAVAQNIGDTMQCSK